MDWGIMKCVGTWVALKVFICRCSEDANECRCRFRNFSQGVQIIDSETLMSIDELFEPREEVALTVDKVVSRERLGGMLKFYYRDAA